MSTHTFFSKGNSGVETETKISPWEPRDQRGAGGEGGEGGEKGREEPGGEGGHGGERNFASEERDENSEGEG